MRDTLVTVDAGLVRIKALGMVYQLISTMEESWLRAILQAFRDAIETRYALGMMFPALEK